MGNALQNCPNNSVNISKVNLNDPVNSCRVDCQYTWENDGVCLPKSCFDANQSQKIKITTQPTANGTPCPIITTRTIPCDSIIPCLSNYTKTFSYNTYNDSPITSSSSTTARQSITSKNIVLADNNDGWLTNNSLILRSVWLYIYNMKIFLNNQEVKITDVLDSTCDFYYGGGLSFPYNFSLNRFQLVRSNDPSALFTMTSKNITTFGLKLYYKQASTAQTYTVKFQYQVIIEYNPCRAGYYQDNLSMCQVCPIGYYCDGYNKLTCPTGTISTTTGASFCTGISCNATGYTGSPGYCTCATGYKGTVTYTNGILGGCSAISCNVTGYTGTAGACTCANGYTGTVNYTNGILGGCSGIPCTTTGYTGTAGACICATGYNGTVTYTNGILGGCSTSRSFSFSSSTSSFNWQNNVSFPGGFRQINYTISSGYYAPQYIVTSRNFTLSSTTGGYSFSTTSFGIYNGGVYTIVGFPTTSPSSNYNFSMSVSANRSNDWSGKITVVY